MIDLFALQPSALTVLRVVVWANVAFAAIMLAGVALWLVCCGIELRHQAR